MAHEWAVIKTVKVHGNRRIRVSPAIKQYVVFDHKLYGDSVHWNLDSEAHAILMAAAELTDERYPSAGSTQLHEQQNTVTPPKELIDAIGADADDIGADEPARFEKGSTAVYLAHEGMVDEEPITFYLLGASRVFDMFDENPADSESIGELLKSADPR